MINLKSPRLGLMVGAFGVSALAVSAYAESQKVVDVSSVQQELNRTHAGWRARESWVTRLSQDEITRMLGLQRPPQGEVSFDSDAHRPGQASSIDWRNVDGVNWLGGVMNQGNCGSCVAFATVATFEARMSVASGLPWLHPSLSPQALFACGGGSCEAGWLPESAADYLISTGIPDEACMPYTSGSTGEDATCAQQCGDASSRNSKIVRSSMPTSYGGSADRVKQALKQGPLVTTLFVYADFMTYAGGVYKHVTGSGLGGHAVSLVGYDDSKRAWLIRNSWGTEWGDHGFAWVSYDDRSGISSDTWAFEIAPSAGYLAVQAPADREYISGQYRLTAQGHGLTLEGAKFHLRGPGGRELGELACASTGAATCSVLLDTAKLAEGRYEISAVTSTGAKSQVREFYVINSQPKLSLSFAAASGTDLSQPLNGRPEFVIQAKSGPVPMQFVEFRVMDSSGKIITRKSNPDVLDEMKMGWRTMTAPPGRYKIFMHGELTYLGQVYAVDSNSFDVTVKN